MPTLECLFCKSEFKCSQYKADNGQKLCSRKCADAYRKSPEHRFWRHIVILDNGCWEWVGSRKQYGNILNNLSAHHYSYMLHKGPIPKGNIIRHTCDFTFCVNPDHLIPGSFKDNSRDAQDRGRTARGERQGSSKLKEAEIITIRELYSSGNFTFKKIALIFNIESSTVGIIVRGKGWTHIEGPIKDIKSSFKLTNYQVEEIKERLSNGERNMNLAFEFGVSRSTISMIAKGNRRL